MNPVPFIIPTAPQKSSVVTWVAIGAGAFVAWKLYAAWRADQMAQTPGYKPTAQLTDEELAKQPGIFTASGIDVISNLFKGTPGREFAVTAETLARLPMRIGDAIIPGPDSLGTAIHRIFNPGT